MTTSNHVADFRKILDRVAIFGEQERVIVIGVCGFAGVGKTTLCEKIVTALPNRAFHLNCDLFSAFSLPERRKRIDLAIASGDPDRIEVEENPQNWYDWSGISTAIGSLRQKRYFDWDRAWNRKTGLLDVSYCISLPACGPAVVLCDCIYLLHDPVRRWFDCTMLVQVGEKEIADRQRRRAKDEASAEYAKGLRERFERPYFESYDSRADCYCSGLLGEG